MAFKIGNRTLSAGGETFDVLSASVSGNVEEVVIPSGTKETVPQVRAYYNPRWELSAEVIGDAAGVTQATFAGVTFKVTNVTKTQSAEDVIKSSISGVYLGASASLS